MFQTTMTKSTKGLLCGAVMLAAVPVATFANEGVEGASSQTTGLGVVQNTLLTNEDVFINAVATFSSRNYRVRGSVANRTGSTFRGLSQNAIDVFTAYNATGIGRSAAAQAQYNNPIDGYTVRKAEFDAANAYWVNVNNAYNLQQQGRGNPPLRTAEDVAAANTARTAAQVRLNQVVNANTAATAHIARIANIATKLGNLTSDTATATLGNAQDVADALMFVSMYHTLESKATVRTGQQCHYYYRLASSGSPPARTDLCSPTQRSASGTPGQPRYSSASTLKPDMEIPAVTAATKESHAHVADLAMQAAQLAMKVAEGQLDSAFAIDVFEAIYGITDANGALLETDLGDLLLRGYGQFYDRLDKVTEGLAMQNTRLNTYEAAARNNTVRIRANADTITSHAGMITAYTKELNNLHQGIAMALAMGQRPVVEGSASSFTIGSGYFDGETAYSFSWNQKLGAVTLSLSGGFADDVEGTSLGLGFSF